VAIRAKALGVRVPETKRNNANAVERKEEVDAGAHCVTAIENEHGRQMNENWVAGQSKARRERGGIAQGGRRGTAREESTETTDTGVIKHKSPWQVTQTREGEYLHVKVAAAHGI